MEYETKNTGTSIAGLTTGIIGTSLGVLNGAGGLAGLWGGNGHASNYVTKDELKYVQELGQKDSEISLLKSESNTENKMIDVYKQAHAEVAALRDTVYANQMAQMDWNASQSVANAQMSNAIATNTASINAINGTLGNITKTIVPATSVCPEPMLKYNSWTAPTTTPTTTG